MEASKTQTNKKQRERRRGESSRMLEKQMAKNFWLLLAVL